MDVTDSAWRTRRDWVSGGLSAAISMVPFVYRRRGSICMRRHIVPKDWKSSD